MSSDIVEEYFNTDDEEKAAKLLSVIYDDFEDYVSNILYVLQLSYDDAQEILNDSFLKLHKNRKKIRNKSVGGLHLWLKTVASRMAMDFFRKNQSKKTIKTVPIDQVNISNKFDEMTKAWSLIVYEFFIICIETLKIFKDGTLQKKVFLHEINHLHIEKKTRYMNSGLDYTTYRTSGLPIKFVIP